MAREEVTMLKGTPIDRCRETLRLELDRAESFSRQQFVAAREGQTADTSRVPKYLDQARLIRKALLTLGV